MTEPVPATPPLLTVEVIDPDGEQIRIRPHPRDERGSVAAVEYRHDGSDDWIHVVAVDPDDLARLSDFARLLVWAARPGEAGGEIREALYGPPLLGETLQGPSRGIMQSLAPSWDRWRGPFDEGRFGPLVPSDAAPRALPDYPASAYPPALRSELPAFGQQLYPMTAHLRALADRHRLTRWACNGCGNGRVLPPLVGVPQEAAEAHAHQARCPEYAAGRVRDVTLVHAAGDRDSETLCGVAVTDGLLVAVQDWRGHVTCRACREAGEL